MDIWVNNPNPTSSISVHESSLQYITLSLSSVVKCMLRTDVIQSFSLSQVFSRDASELTVAVNDSVRLGEKVLIAVVLNISNVIKNKIKLTSTTLPWKRKKIENNLWNKEAHITQAAHNHQYFCVITWREAHGIHSLLNSCPSTLCRDKKI